MVVMAVATSTDGRVQRGARTRAAIAEAMLALLEDGVARPTARDISARAGVSLRSVFQHFADMESLYAECVARQQERLVAWRTPVDPSLPRDERVRSLVQQHARLYEHIAPVRRAGLAVAAGSPVLQDALAAVAADDRHQLSVLFASELRGPSRRERVAAVEVATSFDTWDHLRRVQGCSVATAQRVVARLVRAALEE
jgi:AcrR family transcriptional regulator